MLVTGKNRDRLSYIHLRTKKVRSTSQDLGALEFYSTFLLFLIVMHFVFNIAGPAVHD